MAEGYVQGDGVGVGARHRDSPAFTGGGGYLSTCSILKFRPSDHQKKRDPRLDELEEMGLQKHHLMVAEEIGFDNFLSMWRIYDEHCQRKEWQVLVTMRPYQSYLRYQRNRYIEALNESGMTAKEIQVYLARNLSEKTSITNISRIAGRRKNWKR